MAARLVTLAAFVVAAMAFPPAAQVIVEDEGVIVTDVVNVFNAQPDDGKSIAAAMAMSLAVPGSGHHYFDRYKSAYVYLSIDIASIVGAVAFYSLANQRENEARSFAAVAAGIEKAPGGEAYWRHVGAHMDAAAYNEIVKLSRAEDDNLYADPETWWRWGDESQQKEYNDIRQSARSLRVASSFFLGALAVNRLVSTIELRVFRRREMSSSVRFESSLSPDLSGGAVLMKTDF